MGCFSFKCSGCGDPINSDSFSGEHCVLILLDQGVVQEWMTGQYNSYGQVFDGAMDGQEWHLPWDEVCTLMFSDDADSGICAYHSECWCEQKPEVSVDDHDQGWGDYEHPTDGPEFKHMIGTVETRVFCDLPPGWAGR